MRQYVIVRANQSPRQIMVQAAHAAANLAEATEIAEEVRLKEGPLRPAPNRTLIILQVPDGLALRLIQFRLMFLGVKGVSHSEPDYSLFQKLVDTFHWPGEPRGEDLTAISFYAPLGRYKFLDNLKLADPCKNQQ